MRVRSACAPRLSRSVRRPQLRVDKAPCDSHSMTKGVSAKQERGPCTNLEETLLNLIRWYDSHRRYEALLELLGYVAEWPSANLYDDRPSPIALLAIVPLMLCTTLDRIQHLPAAK